MIFESLYLLRVRCMWVRVILLMAYLRLMLLLWIKSPCICILSSSIKKKLLFICLSLSFWHSRLGHVNYKSLQNLSNLGYILKLNLKEIRKYEICVKAKFAKNSSLNWSRYRTFIHSDLCDLKFALTRGGKKYFITFTMAIQDTVMCIY